MSSELKVNSIRDTSNNEAITISSGNVSFNNTISAGTIADAVTQPNTLYVQGSVASNFTMSGGEMLNLTGTSNPYITWSGHPNSFGNGSGNVTGTTDHDFKFLTKGIYFISFSGTLGLDNTDETRRVQISIRGDGATSESSTILAEAIDEIANVHGTNSDFCNACATYVGVFNANDLINFKLQSFDDNDAIINTRTHISIFLVRTVA